MFLNHSILIDLTEDMILTRPLTDIFITVLEMVQCHSLHKRPYHLVITVLKYLGAAFYTHYSVRMHVPLCRRWYLFILLYLKQQITKIHLLLRQEQSFPNLLSTIFFSVVLNISLLFYKAHLPMQTHVTLILTDLPAKQYVCQPRSCYSVASSRTGRLRRILRKMRLYFSERRDKNHLLGKSPLLLLSFFVLGS